MEESCAALFVESAEIQNLGPAQSQQRPCIKNENKRDDAPRPFNEGCDSRALVRGIERTRHVSGKKREELGLKGGPRI